MRINVRRFILTCIIGHATSASAETVTPAKLIEIGLKNSYLISSQRLIVEEKQKLSDQAAEWENPKFDISTESKKEPGGDTDLIRYGFSQTLYMPGKFSSKQKITHGDFEIAKAELRNKEIELRSKLLNLIYEYEIAKKKFSYASERLVRFQTVESFLKFRVFASPQKKTEASIVVGKLLVLQRELLHIQSQKENLWNELNSYLKLTSEPDISISWYEKGPDLAIQNLTVRAISNSLELQVQNIKLQQSKDEVELAKVESWPSLTVSGGYSASSGYSPEKIYGLGVSFPLPFFNTNRASRAATSFRLRSEWERLSYLKEQTLKSINSAFLEFQLAKKLLAGLAVQKVKDLEKSIRETDRGFMRGQVDLLTYLEADTQHFESVSAIFDAQLDVVKSISNLQTLTGEEQLFLEK